MDQNSPFLEKLKRHLATGQVELPPFDRTGLIIQQEMASDDPDMQVIEYQILRDPVLTSQLLKVANSAFYRGMQEITTVRNAIVRLGLSEVSNLIMMLSQKKTFTSKDPFIRGFMDQLWMHSVACGLAAKWIAKACLLPGKINETFFAGLLHDIGKVLLLTAIAELNNDERSEEAISLYEIKNALALMHTTVGEELLRVWNLPELYSSVARHHHDEDLQGADKVLIMVSLANKTLDKRGIGINHTPDIDLAATQEANLLGLNEADVEELRESVEKYLNFIQEMD